MNQNKFATILNSRQSMRPTGIQEWIISSLKGVSWLRDNSYTLVSSVGMPTWDILTAMGSMNRLPMKLIIQPNKKEDYQSQTNQICYQFDLESQLVEFVVCGGGEQDKKIISQAELIIPVSIRPFGLLEKLISDEQAGGKELLKEFKVNYDTRSTKLSYSLKGLALNPELKKLETNYIIHWTRASNRPWPDEKLIDYYRDIIISTEYPRLAIDTISRILETKLILAGDSNLEKRIKAISFSLVRPHELVGLVKWRARKRQMSFEPYGIGFEPALAEQLGIKPVVYYDKETGLPDTDLTGNKIERWQLQSQGTITDWRNEKELRYPRDLHLDKLNKNQMILFCLKPDEAKILSSAYGIKAVSFLP